MDRYRNEFPDFGDLGVDLPEGFVDVSWHNDGCPCFQNDGLGLFLWIDHADPARRMPGGFRFALEEGSPDPVNGLQHLPEAAAVLETDDLQEVLAEIAERRPAPSA